MPNHSLEYDYLIVGAGIIGMTIAYELLESEPDLNIIIIEKETKVGFHASGRNSGILHAGFYYSADSLKAKFCVDGNKLMKEFCQKRKIKVLNSQKVVVAQNSDEAKTIYELHKRAQTNGVKTKIVSETELSQIEPMAKTYQVALYSPDTASVNPQEVCTELYKILIEKGVMFQFNTVFNAKSFNYRFLINCAGTQAVKIAQSYNCAQNYIVIPFKGLYAKYYGEESSPIKMNIYPVPKLENPFLGVHHTITVDGSLKIGPSATPALGPENYRLFQGINILEAINYMLVFCILFFRNSFGFRKLVFEELKYLYLPNLIHQSNKLLKQRIHLYKAISPGIRAQLYDTNTQKLVTDFKVERTENSYHILNAISPAFTCSFAFAKHVVKQLQEEK